ncbi:MAG: acyl carrier protein [Polyangiaceae bacterium]|nr:acyl carrier protein [Polyangiaceae bacterium]
MNVAQDLRAIVAEHGRLAVEIGTLTEEADLYAAGMTSHASVNLMLAIEDKFEIEFPERMLKRKSFESLLAIRLCVEELVKAKASGG